MFGAFIAERAKQPLLALDDAEARKIADAMANVGKHYDIPVSPVTQAWIALVGTIGAIYYAKIAVIRMTRSLEKGASDAK
jgi:hypothetical protein